MKKIVFTENEFLNHHCIVKGFFKFENYWIEYRAFAYKMNFTSLN